MSYADWLAEQSEVEARWLDGDGGEGMSEILSAEQAEGMLHVSCVEGIIQPCERCVALQTVVDLWPVVDAAKAYANDTLTGRAVLSQELIKAVRALKAEEG